MTEEKKDAPKQDVAEEITGHIAAGVDALAEKAKTEAAEAIKKGEEIAGDVFKSVTSGIGNFFGKK